MQTLVSLAYHKVTFVAFSVFTIQFYVVIFGDVCAADFEGLLFNSSLIDINMLHTIKPESFIPKHDEYLSLTDICVQM